MSVKLPQIMIVLAIVSAMIVGCNDKSPSTVASTSKTHSNTGTQSTSISSETVSWTSLQAQVSQLSSLGKGADQKMEQSKQFVQTAMNQYQLSKTQDEVNNLTQAKTLAESAVQDITQANAILDEIMKLKLSPIMMQYFQAKKQAATALLAAEQIDLDGVNAILADPTFSQQETIQTYYSINSKAQEQTTIVEESERQAAKIANDNPAAFQ